MQTLEDEYDTELSRQALDDVLASLANRRILPDQLKFEDGITGYGGFGLVRRATWRKVELLESLDVAVKSLIVLSGGPTTVRLALRFARELRVWSTIDHPNILPLLGFDIDLSLETFSAYFVSPYLSRGSIRPRLNLQAGASMEQRQQWILDITAGLLYLHTMKDNILLNSEDQAVLCDFGLSSIMEDSGSTGLTTSDSFKGSARWSSPELFENKPRSTWSDVWAWSLCALEILTSRVPFYGQRQEMAVMMRIMQNNPPTRAEYPELPETNELWNTPEPCFEREPTKRPSIQECFVRLTPHLTKMPSPTALGSASDPYSSSSVLSSSQSSSPTRSNPFDRIRVVVGVCLMDIKSRSKAVREILTRLVSLGRGSIDVKIFSDKVILDEDVENWPRCDIFISFFSAGFPLHKAVQYVKLRQPVCINDLAAQELLWDRRTVLAVLDHVGVPCPNRVEVNRDGGPKISEEVCAQLEANIGLKLQWSPKPTDFKMSEDNDAIIVNGKVFQKPFVEKPVSGDDHNIYIYYKGGGGRRLFRQIGNQYGVYEPGLTIPRTNGSYIYEEFVDTENAEGIKVYTVGSTYTHVETRKPPVIDGPVRQNAEEKESRFVTKLTDEEATWARRICEAFGQRVCGFDVLRPKGSNRSMVIDVNGWGFKKGNEQYYDRVSEIFSELCSKIGVTPSGLSIARDFLLPAVVDSGSSHAPGDTTATTEGSDAGGGDGAGSGSWMLKGNVIVFGHADRTPKQKLKYSFPVNEPWVKPFIDIINGEQQELILRKRDHLLVIADAITEAKRIIEEHGTQQHVLLHGYPQSTNSQDDLMKLNQLSTTLEKKIDLPGTKAQLKPTYRKVKPSIVQGVQEDGKVLVTNGAIAQVQEVQGAVGAVPALSDRLVGGLAVSVVASKRPVGGKLLEKFQLVFKWGGEITHAARYQSRDLGENLRRDLLISNKDMLQNVQIFTSSERRVTASAEIFASALLDSGKPWNTPVRSPRVSEAGPTSLTENGSSDMYKLIIRNDLLDDSNAAKDLMDDVKKRLRTLLLTGETERRPDFTWPKHMKADPATVVQEVIQLLGSFRIIMEHNYKTVDVDKIQEPWCCGDNLSLFRERWTKIFEDFCDTKEEKFDPSRVSELYEALKFDALHHRTFLFSIFSEKRGEHDPNDRKLHELYARAKALFDLVAPQEYGIEASEKEEIGILTSLPLLRKIVADLERVRYTGDPGVAVYFTKESHIHPLVNLVLMSGLPIANPSIPELDYSSHLMFELYERNGGHNKSDKEYSMRLSISEGAHSSNVLDSEIDTRHALTVKRRRKLTQHLDYSVVIEKLSKHFHRVPKDEDEEPSGAIDAPISGRCMLIGSPL